MVRRRMGHLGSLLLGVYAQPGAKGSATGTPGSAQTWMAAWQRGGQRWRGARAYGTYTKAAVDGQGKTRRPLHVACTMGC